MPEALRLRRQADNFRVAALAHALCKHGHLSLFGEALTEAGQCRLVATRSVFGFGANTHVCR